MATLRQQAFPLADYPSGVRQFGPLNVRQQDNWFRLVIRRCTSADLTLWPNASTSIVVAIELSLDNGQNWASVGGFTAIGGILTRDDTGAESPETSFKTQLKGSGNQRRLRFTVTIAGGPLRSEGFLDLLDDPA